MLLDARNPDVRLDIETDIAIIGGGVAGITLARKLSPHFKITLIESGGTEFDAATQDLYDGESTGLDYSLTATRLRYLGGTSNHWGGWCGIFDDIDFEHRPWVPYSGWPITPSDLQPYYGESADILDLGSPNFDPEALAPEPASRMQLGGRWLKPRLFRFSKPVTRFGQKYRDELDSNHDILGLLNANLTEILLDESGQRVSHLKIKTLTGRSGRIRAKRVIIACGGIENARLLLVSNKQNNTGIGNDHDLVGRFFMEHPHIELAHLQFHDQDWCRIATALRQDNSHWFGLGPTLSTKALRHFKCLNFTGQLFNHDCENDSPMRMGIIAEQAPNPNSRITLASQPDALGVPRARVDWRLTELDRTSLRRAAEILGREFGRSNTGRVMISPALLEDTSAGDVGYGSHQMGTTRMAHAPSEGVVDANCRVHGIDNLYIAGSSVYPTGGPINPTLTLVALSLRLAEQLQKDILHS